MKEPSETRIATEFYELMQKHLNIAHGFALEAVDCIAKFESPKNGCETCNDEKPWPPFKTLDEATEYAKNAINDVVVMRDTMLRMEAQFWCCTPDGRAYVKSCKDAPKCDDTCDDDGYPPIGEGAFEFTEETLDPETSKEAGITYSTMDKIFQAADPEGVEITPMNTPTLIPVPPKPLTAAEAVKRYTELQDSVLSKNKALRNLLRCTEEEFEKNDIIKRQEKTVGLSGWSDMTMNHVEPISAVAADIVHHEYDEIEKAEKEKAIEAESKRIYDELVGKHHPDNAS